MFSLKLVFPALLLSACCALAQNPASSTSGKAAQITKHSHKAETHPGEASAGNVASEQKDLEAAFSRIKDPHKRMQVGLQLVRVYRLRGHLNEAARLIAVLEQQQPQNPDLLYAAYRVNSELVARSMAALALTAPNSAQMHAVIAREDAMQNNNQDAIAEYRKALALDPKLPGVHYELAELLSFSSDTKQQAEAASFFHASLKANPRDEISLVAIGNMALMQGNFKQAKGYFQRALKVNPEDEEANLGLAKAFMDMDQFRPAKPYLMKAIQLDPASVSAHFRLATLYRIAGRRQESHEQLVIFAHLRQIKMQHMSLYTKMRQQPMQPEGGMGSR
jgi:cytochrome c-type biogenesis protein CcmH/NrfG